MSEPEAEQAPAMLAQEELEALRPRAATDVDIARLVATVDAYAAQRSLIYTPEPGLKLAPVPFEPFEPFNDTTWASKSGWKVSLEQRDGKEFWALYQVTGTREDLWSLYDTREAAMAIAEEMQYPGPDEGPDDVHLVWSQNNPEGALEEWISPDGTAWHLHYGGR